MEWARRVNLAMAYVEEHLAEAVDKRMVEGIVCCPYDVFRSLFARNAGMTLDEYVRRRRLTEAACELLNTSARVCDVARRYGYRTADSFRTAFRRMHGMAPSGMRRTGARFLYCCRYRMEFPPRSVDKMRCILVRRREFGTQEGSRVQYPESLWLHFRMQGRISGNPVVDMRRRIDEEFFPRSRFVKGGYKKLPDIEKYILWDVPADFCEVEIQIPVDEKEY